MYGLANMLLFLLLINYIAALISIQLLRGDIPSNTSPNFSDLWSAFLAIYQVFSSENWTAVLYTSTGAELSLGQAPIAAIFITAWLLFANCESFSFIITHEISFIPLRIKFSFCKCSLPSSTKTSKLWRNLRRNNKLQIIGPTIWPTELRRGRNLGSVA